jgi:hypothetical protein
MIQYEKKPGKVQGLVKLPPGYGLQRCPGTPPLEVTRSNTDLQVRSTYRGAETVVALFQIMFAMMSLYRSVGREIQTYGYAAFSFTVLPFAVMSLGNLLACFASPDYEGFHLVRSLEMEEAIGRGAGIHATVGSLVPVEETGGCSRVCFHHDGGKLCAYRIRAQKVEYLGEVIRGSLSSPSSQSTHVCFPSIPQPV